MESYSWYKQKPDPCSADFLHQTLVYGKLEEAHSLVHSLGKKRAQTLFIKHPKKLYTRPALNFIKNFLLELEQPLNEVSYLKTTPRVVR